LLPVFQALPALENYCLLLLLRAPDFIYEFEELTPDDFLVVENRTILLALLDYLEGEKPFDLDQFRATLDPLLAQHLDPLLEKGADEPSLSDEELSAEIARSVVRIKDRNDRRELEQLESLLRDARERGDAEEEFAVRERVGFLMQKIRGRRNVEGRESAWARTSSG
jgi:replicative DNA helicase